MTPIMTVLTFRSVSKFSSVKHSFEANRSVLKLAVGNPNSTLAVSDIFTLYNVCSVPWGFSVLWREYHEYCGDILSTVGVFITMGDIMINVRDILSTMGCSVPWGIMSTVRVILSTMGDIMMHMGGCHEFCGVCSVPWGIFVCNLSTVGIL